MTPTIALTGCIIFILFLLYMERKQHPDTSFALWIPTIWLLMVSTKPLGTLFVIGDPTSMQEGSILDRLALGTLFFAGLAILIKRHFAWFTTIRRNKLLFILIGFMLVSMIWSEMPYVSFKRFIRGGATALVMALLVASEIDSRQALISLFTRVIYIEMPLSIFLIKYYNELGITWNRWNGEVMWIGVSQQKNGLALLCLFAIFFILWQLASRWKDKIKPAVWYQTYVQIFLLALALWMFMGPRHSVTYSATSTATLVMGVFCFCALYYMNKKGLSIGSSAILTFLVAGVILYGIITFVVGGFVIVDPSDLLSRTQTLTGRSEIWSKLIPLAWERPFFGHGFGGFWTDEFRDLVKTSDAHNGYLDVVLNTGFVGLILMSAFLILSGRKAQLEMKRNFFWGAFWFSMVLMIVIHNIAESSIDAFTGLTPLIIFIHIASQGKEKEITSKDSTFLLKVT